MNPPISDVEAKILLDKIARKSKVKGVLASRFSHLMLLLVSSISSGIAVYVMADFAASIAVKILVSAGFVCGLVNLIDGWQQQRRLDAAIELLLQSEII